MSLLKDVYIHKQSAQVINKQINLMMYKNLFA